MQTAGISEPRRKSGGKGLGKAPGKDPKRGHTACAHVNAEVWRRVCKYVCAHKVVYWLYV